MQLILKCQQSTMLFLIGRIQITILHPLYHKKFPLKYQKAVSIVKGSMRVLIPLRRLIFITFTFSVNFYFLTEFLQSCFL